MSPLSPPVPAKNTTQDQDSDSEELKALYAEALWYDQFQQSFTASLRDAIEETEAEIVRAHRSLAITEREHRDWRRVINGKLEKDEYEIEVKKMKDATRELDEMIEKLEEKGRKERELMAKVNGA